jgi:hypothetical protein
MKSLRLIATGMILILASAGQAQFSMSINFGPPPPWGPVGYASVQYYYLPDVEAYYDVHTSMFIYFSGSAWVHRAYLPARYQNYDLYGGYKVVMPDYHGNAPYGHFKEHKMKYAKGYRGKPQRTIGERPRGGHPGDHNSYSSPHYGNQGGDHEKRNNAGNGKSHGGSHGHEKNNKENQSHGNGNGKNK